ncbi:hypothetical protein HYD77_00820 [Mycoplasmopsis bovis]|nr:hypothetical protein [Mycoplasmopsis bovis]QQH43514.1 hypothetical protein HYD77_00820 [Mycoplasmopsis bovis]
MIIRRTKELKVETKERFNRFEIGHKRLGTNLPYGFGNKLINFVRCWNMFIR